MVIVSIIDYMTDYRTLRLRKDVVEKLDNLRHRGQSYTGLLEELAELAESLGFGKMADQLGLIRPSEGPPLPKKTGKRWKKK